jgi:DNA invertase Pin-like site-specific DNA recombinase
MALIGYARVSTVDQNPALQLDALNTAGCDPVFSDHASGAREKRPDLDRCLGYLRSGDTLVVWRLDRLGRSLRHLVTLVADLGERDIGFRSLTENIDTTTAGGRLIFHVMAALAEFEREIIKERSIAGVAAARARGRKPGRPTSLPPDRVTTARDLLAAGHNHSDVARTLHVARTTLYRALTTDEAESPDAPPSPAGRHTRKQKAAPR